MTKPVFNVYIILQHVFIRFEIFKHLFRWFDYRNKKRYEQKQKKKKKRYELYVVKICLKKLRKMVLCLQIPLPEGLRDISNLTWPK